VKVRKSAGLEEVEVELIAPHRQSPIANRHLPMRSKVVAFRLPRPCFEGRVSVSACPSSVCLSVCLSLLSSVCVRPSVPVIHHIS
jgi:hypothetical protein